MHGIALRALPSDPKLMRIRYAHIIAHQFGAADRGVVCNPSSKVLAVNSGGNSWRHLAQQALELCCNQLRVHTLDSPLRPTCLVFRVQDEQGQLWLFLRAHSAQQYRHGRRLFLLSALGYAATTKFQLATEAAFQCGSVRHTTKV